MTDCRAGVIVGGDVRCGVGIVGDRRVSDGLLLSGGTFNVEVSLLFDGDLARFAESTNQCLMDASWLIMVCWRFLPPLLGYPF